MTEHTAATDAEWRLKRARSAQIVIAALPASLREQIASFEVDTDCGLNCTEIKIRALPVGSAHRQIVWTCINCDLITETAIRWSLEDHFRVVALARLEDLES